MKRYLLLLIIALLLSGCASMPKADKAAESQAKTFSPRPDSSNIYFYRTVRFGGGALNFRVAVNGQPVSVLSNGTFIQLELPPGTHKLSSVLESTPFNPELSSPVIELEAEAGKNYFFQQETIVGTSGAAENDLRQASDAVGKKGVAGCHMLLVTDATVKAIAAAAKLNRLAVIPANFPSASQLTAPTPIAGNSGRFKSPFTSNGAVALWAKKVDAYTDNGSDLAANVGGAVGAEVGRKALDFLPMGLGGMIGQRAGQSAGRTLTQQTIEPQLPTMEAITASSDISFNTADELAVYMYARHSMHSEYARIFKLTQQIYPELVERYVLAIEQAAKSLPANMQSVPTSLKKEKSADDRLEALKRLKEKGLITDADYQTKKSKIIEEL